MDRVSLVALAAAAGAWSLAARSAGAQTVQVQLEPVPPSAAQLPWRELAQDPASDGKMPRLPDARSLAMAYDEKRDEVWFRVGLEKAPPKESFGMNIAIDGDLDQTNGTAWWGVTSGWKFDRLVTVWLRDVGPFYQGSMGVADTTMVASWKFGTPLPARVRAWRDEAGRALLVCLARPELDADGRFDVIATVGSSYMGNDSVPDSAAVHVELPPRTKVAIDDFEDGDVNALTGTAWLVIADDEVGGESTGRTKIVSPGAGSAHALRLEGDLHAGKSAIVGMWAPPASNGFGADLRGYRGLRFRARGDGREYAAGFFTSDKRHMGLQMANFKTTSTWQPVEILFDQLARLGPPVEGPPWDGADANVVGFATASGYDGHIQLDVDDVELFR